MIVSITKTMMMGVKLMTEKHKTIHIKVKVSAKISVTRRIHIFSCTTMIAKHLT